MYNIVRLATCYLRPKKILIRNYYIPIGNLRPRRLDSSYLPVLI